MKIAEDLGHSKGRTKLAALAQYFQINVEENKLHRALYDAELTAKVYYELT